MKIHEMSMTELLALCQVCKWLEDNAPEDNNELNIFVKIFKLRLKIQETMRSRVIDMVSED